MTHIMKYLGMKDETILYVLGDPTIHVGQSGHLFYLGATACLINVAQLTYESAFGRCQDPLFMKAYRDLVVNRDPGALGLKDNDPMALKLWKLCYLAYLLHRLLTIQISMVALCLFGQFYLVSWPYPFNLTLVVAWWIVWTAIWAIASCSAVAIFLSCV